MDIHREVDDIAGQEALQHVGEEPSMAADTETAPRRRGSRGWVAIVGALTTFAVVVLSIALTLAVAWRMFAFVAGA